MKLVIKHFAVFFYARTDFSRAVSLTSLIALLSSYAAMQIICFFEGGILKSLLSSEIKSQRNRLEDQYMSTDVQYLALAAVIIIKTSFVLLRAFNKFSALPYNFESIQNIKL